MTNQRAASGVWGEWNALADDNPSPVKTVARKLGLDPADVAAVVYPVETFALVSDDDQEPDLPTMLRSA
jgi:hypothetical protein